MVTCSTPIAVSMGCPDSICSRLSVKTFGSYIIGPKTLWTVSRINADKPGI